MSHVLFKACISLLIFFLKNLSIDVSEVLKFHNTILLLILSAFYLSVNIYFTYLGAPILEKYMLTNFMSSSCIDSFIIILSLPKSSFGFSRELFGQHNVMSFFVFYYRLCFKIYFVWCEYCYLTVHFRLHGIPFSNPLIFNLCMSAGLKWVCCRQHWDRSH